MLIEIISVTSQRLSYPMFGRRLTVSALSARILKGMFHYAQLAGVISLGIRPNGNGRLVAYDWYWHKWLSLLIRVCAGYLFFCSVLFYHSDDEDLLMKFLCGARLVGCFTCFICMLVLQFLLQKRVICVINRFLRLFQRVRALSNTTTFGEFDGFGGTRELVLLIFKMFCLIFELLFKLPMIWEENTPMPIAGVFGDIYTTIGAGMIINMCFLCYLSVGALYAEINSYVRHELRRRLRSLQRHKSDGNPSRGFLRSLGERLDECLSVYNGVERAANDFHKLFELPLCLSLMMNFSAMALVSYYVIIETEFQDYRMWCIVVKLFMDVVLLTLAAHGAASSSRIMKRLSLENYYVSEQPQSGFNTKMEIFFNRLNFYEFHVRPLGLFEVSNELILFFLSALITYLTYIVQCGIQSQHL